MKFFERLLRIDRKIIYLLIAALVILPLVRPLGLGVKAGPRARALFDAVDAIPTGRTLLISVDFDPSSMPELYPMLVALMRHAFARDVKVLLCGLWITGAGLADQAMRQVAGEFRMVSVVGTRRDVAVTDILCPVAADSGTDVPVSAVISNRGSRAETAAVQLMVLTGVSAGRGLPARSAQAKGRDTLINIHQSVGLARGQVDTVVLADIPTATLGEYSIEVRVSLPDDENPGNDLRSKSFRVTRPQADGAVEVILAPSGILEAGLAVTPAGLVANRGTARAEIPVTLRILRGKWPTGTEIYRQSVVTGLGPGDVDTVVFGEWQVPSAGEYQAVLATGLPGDGEPRNDTASAGFAVREPLVDAAVVAVLSPVGRVDSGVAVIPRVGVANHGSRRELIPVSLNIGSDRFDTLMDVGPGDTVMVRFPSWLPVDTGTLPVSCRAVLAGDSRNGNDEQGESVRVVTRVDAAVRKLVVPASACAGDSVAISVVVANLGTRAESVSIVAAVLQRSDTAWEEQRTELLAAGESKKLCLGNWQPERQGKYRVATRVYLDGDAVARNDTATAMIPVTSVEQKREARDVSAVTVLAPAGIIDSGITVVPRVTVTNLGSRPESVPVSIRIGNSYQHDTIVWLEPAWLDTLIFPAWSADSVGTYPVLAYTRLAGDRNRSNDTALGREYGRDYVYLGWKAGVDAVILGMGENIKGVFPVDYYGHPLEQLPMMHDVQRLRDIPLGVALSAGTPGYQDWMLYGQARYGLKLGAGVTAVSAADAYPFLQSGQLSGLLSGMAGAAEYELMVERAGYSRAYKPAVAAMDSQSLAHVVIMVLVIVGNVAFFVTRKRRA